MRKRRRKAEKTFKRTGLIRDKELFQALRAETTRLSRSKKMQYFTVKITEAVKPKTLFSVTKRLLDIRQNTRLPTANNDCCLANNFLTYFKEKIISIRKSFTDDCHGMIPTLARPLPLLSEFNLTTEEE